MPETSEAIELQPFYHDIKNTIVRPKQVVVGTRYFWEKWAPRLGPTLSVLIVRLRMHCYYNQASQERRDWCFPTQQTLAEEIGVSRWTVMRELKKPEARLFVRVQYRSKYDPARRITVRISSLYHVAMDDPLIDADRGRAALLAAEHMLRSAEERQDAHCGLTDPGRQVAERPFTGDEAKRLITQVATGPGESKLPPKEEPELELSAADAVARELVDEQISPLVAARLAQSYSAELIHAKMALVRQMKDLRNAPGFLRKAIEEDYQPPLAATGTDDASAGLLQPRIAGAPAAEPANATAAGAITPGAGLLRSRADHGGEPAVQALNLFTLSGLSRNVNVWEATKANLAQNMKAAAFAQWLQPSRMLHYELGRICVVAPDCRVQRYLEQRLKPEIEAALRVSCGGPTTLQVVTEGEAESHVGSH